MAGYVELHCHSCYSLREGASMPAELLDRAASLGYDTLALTDHDGLYGAMEFAREARDRGIRPITGAEITLPDGHHLTLLAESARGYANLCRIISFLAGTPMDVIVTASSDSPDRLYLPCSMGEGSGEPAPVEGLIALSGCAKGEVPSLIQEGRITEAEAAARRYLKWFGRGNFFIELQQNLVYGDTARNAALVALAERLRVGIVATNNVHYHMQERSRLHDVLIAIRHRTTLDASHRLRRANAEFYLKAPRDMVALFAQYPEAISTSRVIAERCAGFVLDHDLQYVFPDYAVKTGYTPITFLTEICRKAMDRKYDPFERSLRARAEARLHEELSLIDRHNLAGFFLTYRDILELAGEIAHELRGRDPTLPPDERPVGRGRGSSVSSIVCYLIGLSHVDPVRNDLFLGRFLNEEFGSVPDIDLDFPRDIRAALIERMYAKYQGRVGLVCILPTYRLRSAVRDVGKALGLPPADLDKLAKLGGGWARPTELTKHMAGIPEFAARANIPIWRHLVDIAEQLSGFPRHVSQHVGGMVISAAPISDAVPLEPARMDGRYLIQWDKDSADDARFVKIDFLALGMLSLVDECLDTIEERRGRRIDFNKIHYDDPEIYDRICQADTVGLFQIESRAQIQTLPHTQPRDIDDLAVEVAIVRPGPIVGGAFRPYLQYRRQVAEGIKPDVEYDHESLKPALQETLGVILYQEQVLQVAMAVGGFTVGQAELLRRSMSRRRSHEAMQAFWQPFRDGAAAQGIAEEKAETIFKKLLGFAAFGFPKSHAVAFARLAYESAWLRYKYPAEYLSALFNNQPMGFYTPGVLTRDAERHNIQVLGPHANLSGARCTVASDQAVRLGFSSLHEISADAAEVIVAARGSAEFRSLFDFVQRTGLHRAAIESLIIAGAFDDFGLERRELLWQLGLFVGVTGQRLRRGAAGAPARGRQLMLPLPVEQDMALLQPMSDWDRLVADHYALDFSPSTHPLKLMRQWLGEGFQTSVQVANPQMKHGMPVQMAGMIVSRQQPSTAKGVLFVLLEDEFGLTNIVVYPSLHARQRNLIRSASFVIVDGIVQRNGPTHTVLAHRLQAMNIPRDLAAPASHDFH